MKIPGYKPLGQLFWVWIKWLQDLGGQWEYVGPDPTLMPALDALVPKRTGRRDPDKKPRTYSLNEQHYHKSEKGTLTKWSTRVGWGLRLGE